MTTLTRTTQSPAALAAAIALAVAAVTAATMPTLSPTPTAEQSGDTTPGLGLTPTAQYTGFCTLVGSLPGDPPQQNCRRIPVTVPASHDTFAVEAAR